MKTLILSILLIISLVGCNEMSKSSFGGYYPEREVRVNFNNNITSYDVAYCVWHNSEIVHIHYHFNQRLVDVKYLDSIEIIHISLLKKMNTKP